MKAASFENPYLNKQNQMKNALGEFDLAVVENQDKAFFQRDEFVQQVYSTFIKEKDAILIYVNELV